MTAGHFIAWLQLALNRNKHLDHFHHARGQIITTTDFLNFILKAGIHLTLLSFILIVQCLDNLGVGLISQRQLPPLTLGQHAQNILGDFRIRPYALGAFDGSFANNHAVQTRIGVTIQDDHFVIAVAR